MPATVDAQAKPAFNNTQGNITLTLGDVYSHQLPMATDADNDALTYTLEPKTSGTDPALSEFGLTFTAATRTLAGTAALATPFITKKGTYVYKVVDDESPAKEAMQEVTITVQSTVSFGTTTISDMRYKVDQAIDTQLPTAMDSRTGGTFTYGLDPDPSTIGLTFTAVARHLGGTATPATVETEYTYTATSVVDSVSAAAQLKFKITVVADSDPVFGPASISDITGTVGTEITRLQLPTATDTDGDDITYALTPDLPAGLTFDMGIRLIEGTPTERTEDDAGMQAAVTYTWTATDADGGTPATKMFDINIMGPGVLAQPTGVMVAQNTDQDAYMVSWTPPADTAGIMGYYVSHNPVMYVSGASTTSVEIGTTKPTAVSVWSTADSADMSPTAAPAGVTPAMADAAALAALADLPDDTMAATPPAAPASISAVAGDGEAIVTWAAVADATSYEYSTDGSAWAPIAAADITTNTDGSMSTTVTGLTNGTGYMFYVRGVNSEGDGTASAASGSVTPMPALTAPGAVTNLAATAGNGQVMLSWTGPTTGGAVDSYEYSMNGGVSWMAIPNSDAATTSYTVMNLTNGQDYSFIVRAVNAAGNAASNEISSTPMMTPAPVAPASISATAGDGEVTLTWAAVTGATSYDYSKDGGTAWVSIAAADLTTNTDGTLSTTVTGLANGTAVSFTVRAVGPGGDGAASVAASATPMMEEETPASATFSYTVPAKSYVIVAKTTSPAGLPAAAIPANAAAGSSPTTIQAWSTMPNLEDLFFRGGSLLLVTGKTKLDRDGKADTATEEAKERDVLVTEIMAARNTSKVGMAGYLTHQWIELYNNLPVAVSVTLSHKAGRPAPSAAGTEIKLDLVSNVINPGWDFTGLGADGFDNSDEVALGIAPTLRPFTSFYRKERGKDGHTKGHWATSTDTYVANHIGTPGAKERSGSIAVGATNPTYNVVINEIGNYANDAHDWVELRNVNQGDGNLQKWQLWEITGSGDDGRSTILNMPDNDKHKIGAVGEVLLIVATDPYQDPSHPLAAGVKINHEQGREEKTGLKSRYYVAGTDFKLSNSGKTLLLLRSRNDGGVHEGIVDLTGTQFISDQSNAFATDIWPLKGQTKGNDNHGHGDVVKGADEDFRSGHVYQRINAGRGTGKEVWERRGYTGIGYKRSASATGQNGGTPGYDNGLIKEKDADLAGDASVSISEIMYERGTRGNLPQWIELYNSSHTQAINLNEWKLKIENDRDDDDVDVRSPAVTIANLGGTIIHPNQTILIVAYSGRSSREGLAGTSDFPASRVINLSGKGELEIAASASKRNYRLLSSTAFKLTLIEKGGGTVDIAGNLGASPAWDLPTNDVNEGRASIIRRYNEGGATTGGAGMAADGTMGVWSGGKGTGGMAGDSGWVYAAASDLAGVRQNETYYGNADDRSTPGYRDGGPLPVSLSKFRPERMKDTGEIVIRWVTESELNNAGFNILRSDKRDGEFTKIHFEAGHGTTSEQHAYEWSDKSAKPNVVYYYQIQDVSLDGEVTTLRTTHLRGNVTAVGKAATTWGEIKALQ